MLKKKNIKKWLFLMLKHPVINIDKNILQLEVYSSEKGRDFQEYWFSRETNNLTMGEVGLSMQICDRNGRAYIDSLMYIMDAKITVLELYTTDGSELDLENATVFAIKYYALKKMTNIKGNQKYVLIANDHYNGEKLFDILEEISL